MPPRLPSERRRQEIIDATLALLATTPIQGVTTREVARRVGVSQPALFRHFRSRDAILEAVVTHARERLEALAEQVLQPGNPPLEALEALLRGVVGYSRTHPGLPRLLFQDAASSPAAPYQHPLRHLVSMQRALASELVRQAQRTGEVAESVDAERAGSLFVALIQGVLLQWQLSDRCSDLERQADALLALWRAGLAAGEPQSGRADAPQADPIAPALSVLDVRPMLEDGRDPLGLILRQLEHLPVDGVLKVIAPFRPGPLLSLLDGRGYRATARQAEPHAWQVEIQPPGPVEIMDYRDLEAPLPMERILEATPGLPPGGALLARVPHVPRPLFPLLRKRQLSWLVYREPDGTALIRVCRPA